VLDLKIVASARCQERSSGFAVPHASYPLRQLARLALGLMLVVRPGDQVAKRDRVSGLDAAK